MCNVGGNGSDNGTDNNNCEGSCIRLFLCVYLASILQPFNDPHFQLLFFAEFSSFT